MSGINGHSAVRGLVEGPDYHYVPNDPDRLMVMHRQADVAGMLGIGVRTFREWLSKGCPGTPGNYVMAEIIQWHLEQRAGCRVCRECLRPL